MKTYRVATIPGDGIGKEVVPAGQTVLAALAAADGSFAFDFENFGWGGDWYRAHGEMMPADGLNALKGKDAILFGSAGDPHIADHITLWGLRLKICQGFDQYANVRPTRILPGIDGPLKRCKPEDLNWVIVRENSEGEYSGVGGRVHQGHPIEAATDVSIMTRAGVERILRFAFRLAQSRPRKLLTVVTKSNAQRHAMVMWDEIALQVSREFPDVAWDKELVDAATARMVNRPASLDTLVATNLHADILSDLAAALAGSLGAFGKAVRVGIDQAGPIGDADTADLFTGMYATVGILAALRHAERTGEGQAIDMALLDTQVAMLANLGANFLVSGQVPGRAGNAHANIVPYQVFEVAPPPGTADTARDHLILAVGNDGQFARFCGVAGCSHLAADPRFARNADRV